MLMLGSLPKSTSTTTFSQASVHLPSLHTLPPPNLHRKPPLPIPRPPHHPLPAPTLDNRCKRIQRRLTTRKPHPVLIRPRTKIDPRVRSAPQMLAPPHGGRDVTRVPFPRGEVRDALAEHGVGARELVVRGVGRAAEDLSGGCELVGGTRRRMMRELCPVPRRRGSSRCTPG